jgi:hypothetical protein
VAAAGTPAPPPSVEEVRRIAGVPSHVLRNLEITQCYWRLAAAVAGRTGEGANWCTWATWASRQAGRTIRGEDLGDHLRHRLRHGRELLHPIRSLWRLLLRRGLFQPETRLGRLTAQLHTPFDAVERASDAVARGNRKVFEEIGLEFARYLEEPYERFAAGLRPGDPPEGQEYLRRAFGRYERLRAEDDRRTRAELLVLANLEIGLHEQTRLQAEIREALDAGAATTRDLGLRTLLVLFPSARHWPRLFAGPAAAALGAVATRLQRISADVAREAVTRSFMTLALPGRVLALGVHLEDPFPEELAEVADEELAELVARFEPVPPAPDDCGATDWAVLEQRMHYISHLFRALHGRSELSDPPFTEAQVESFRSGRVPSGEL